MKKSFFFAALISIVVFISSCGEKDPQKLILGSWNNTSTNIEKFDQVAQGVYDANVQYLQMQLTFYQSQMDTISDTNSLAIYQSIVADIQNQISTMTLDSVKADLKNNYDIGTFVFNEDKSLVIKKDMDSLIASWNIAGDTLTLTIQEQPIPLTIKEISSKSMTLIQENSIDTLQFNIEYTFSK